MENRTGRTIGLILANASSSFTTAFMDLFQQELYQKDYKLVIGLTNHDLEKERFYLEFFGRTTEGIIILSDSSEYRELADACTKYTCCLYPPRTCGLRTYLDHRE